MDQIYKTKEVINITQTCACICEHWFESEKRHNFYERHKDRINGILGIHSYLADASIIFEESISNLIDLDYLDSVERYVNTILDHEEYLSSTALKTIALESLIKYEK